MDILRGLLSWYHSPYLVALACCLLFGLLQVAVSGDEASDAEVNDGDFAGEADLPAVFSTLGIGKIPLMQVLMWLLGSFGICGLLINLLVIELFNFVPIIGFTASLPLSAIAAFAITQQGSAWLIQRGKS